MIILIEVVKFDKIQHPFMIKNCQQVVAQSVKNPPAVQETQIQSLGWEDPLEKVMETHCSILAWRIPTN